MCSGGNTLGTASVGHVVPRRLTIGLGSVQIQLILLAMFLPPPLELLDGLRFGHVETAQGQDRGPTETRGGAERCRD